MTCVAIISDMHGNAVAFQAVLDDIAGRGIEQTVCLGDAIQGGPQPHETAALLRELDCPVIMGNADAWLLSGIDTAESATEDRVLVRAWSLEQLSSEVRAFIAGFQPTAEVVLDANNTLLCFHGSPRSFDHLIFPDTPDDELAMMLGPVTARWLTGGHTHLQQLRRAGDATFINPGSIGRVIDAREAERRGDPNPPAPPWAEYAILSIDNGTTSVEFRQIPIDVAALIDVTRSSGRPFAELYIAQYC